MFFTTIQTHPRADKFFEDAAYTDGAEIEPEVFYALVLDGDITSPSLIRREITPEIIPTHVVMCAAAFTSTIKIEHITRHPMILQSKYLHQFYLAIKHILPRGKPHSLAAFLCIGKHLQEFAYRKECLARYNNS